MLNMGSKNTIFGIVKFFEHSCVFEDVSNKALETNQNDGFQNPGPSKTERAYRFHAYEWSNIHITLILGIVFAFSMEKT